MYEITTPKTKSDFKHYFFFRWKVLRKPWRQNKGSEKDDLENVSEHRMATVEGKIIAVGRLHFIDSATAQIRYVAVDKAYENQGIGKAIYTSLENEARNNKIKVIILNARENAVGFYEKLGFTIIKKTYLLFNEIQHFEMHKHL